MPSNLLSRKIGDYQIDISSNLKEVLGETLWDTYEKTNTLSGGALDRVMQDSYYNINVNYEDYGLQFEKNTYIDDMKQDYKVTLSKRF